MRTAHAFTRNVGMHCACVHTNSNLMRGFVANPPPSSCLIVPAALTGFGMEKVAQEIPIASTSSVLKRLQFDHSFVVHACVFNL